MIAKKTKSGIFSLIVGVLAAFVTVKAQAAERISFNFFPLGEFYLQVDDLDAFVTTGEMSSELVYYLDRLPEKQVAVLPQLLSTPLEFNPLTIAKFSNSAVGEAVIKNFAKGIQVDRRNGFYALRGAIIAAAFDESGLTIINLLKRFPAEEIHLDLNVLSQYFGRGKTLLTNREAIDRAWFAEDSQQSSSKQLPDRSPTKKYSWQKQTLAFRNPNRDRPSSFDFYLPDTQQPTPAIVISHGVASSRQTFAYLAKHLASQGFAVATIEHEGISQKKFARFLAGKAKFPAPDNLLDQPLDVTHVLNRLEKEPQIDMKRVGIIGQSFGGYTALALAGATLGDRQTDSCNAESYNELLLDLSSLAKCTIDSAELPLKLHDPRIKAAIAINPMAKIFGREGMNTIDVPVAIVSGTNDLIMPPIEEQIKPFTWLKKDLAKYLVLVKPGTHFSFLQEDLGVLPVPNDIVGPSPTNAHPALEIFSTEFFQTHLAHQGYLERTKIAKNLASVNTDSAFELAIIRSLTEVQLRKAIDSSGQ